MKIKNLELLEKLFSEKLAVLRNPSSTLEQLVKALNSRVETPADMPFTDGRDEDRFVRHVIVVTFRERITSLLNRAKTFAEAFAIWKALPRDKFRENAALRALELANCHQALDLYRGIHFGYIGEQVLNKAARLARTQDELWQVAVHSRTCGNQKLWKQAVKKLATKLK